MVPWRRNAGRGAGTAELEPFPAGPSEEGAGARGLWSKVSWPREQAARFLLHCHREKGTRALRLSKQSAGPSRLPARVPLQEPRPGSARCRPAAAKRKKIRKGFKKNKLPGSFFHGVLRYKAKLAGLQSSAALLRRAPEAGSRVTPYLQEFQHPAFNLQLFRASCKESKCRFLPSHLPHPREPMRKS